MKNNPVRVLHVFNWFDQGGIENFVMNVYRNIDRTKVQFDFALIENKKGYFDDEAKALGADIHFFDSSSNNAFNYYRNLRRIIKENGPYDVVHSHIYYYSGIVLLIARICGVKTRISHSHETEKGRKQTLARKCYERAMRWLIKKNATHCLACSDAAGSHVFGKEIKYQVVYNGIDMRRFQYNEMSSKTVREELGIGDKLVIMNVGRFAPQKNHDLICDIFRGVIDKTDAHLILIGTGPLLEETIERMKAMGIYDKVSILHNIQNTEAYYCAADVFILPSLYEGMSIVSVEAQATGLQSVISDKVTREIAISDIAEYLPIDKGAEPWVDWILENAGREIERERYAKIFESSPFNVKTTVKDLTNIYSSGRE